MYVHACDSEKCNINQGFPNDPHAGGGFFVTAGTCMECYALCVLVLPSVLVIYPSTLPAIAIVSPLVITALHAAVGCNTRSMKDRNLQTLAQHKTYRQCTPQRTQCWQTGRRCTLRRAC